MKLVLLLVLAFSISCSDLPEKGPVKIYYGEDICERCKMIISEKDFASQYQRSDGKTLKFDDLGCMIHYMHDIEKTPISDVYVMDYQSREWINGENSYYIWTESISTPMGYGIIALNDSKGAEELSKKENGKYLKNLKKASDWVLDDLSNNQD